MVRPNCERRQSNFQITLGDGDDAVTAEQLRSFCLTVAGGDGLDYVRGGSGADVLCAGAVADWHCDFTEGVARSQPPGRHDIIFGGAGNDQVAGDGFTNALHGGPGDDYVLGGGGDDLLIGDQGNDNLTGGEGDDRIDTNYVEARVGEQQQVWTRGNDTIWGGEGFDTVGYEHHTAPVQASGNRATSALGGHDEFEQIEEIFLSEADDNFGPGPQQQLTVHGLTGNDQINVGGDRSLTYNQRVFCGEGVDTVTLDVNGDPTDETESFPPPIGILEDTQDGCERPIYQVG